MKLYKIIPAAIILLLAALTSLAFLKPNNSGTIYKPRAIQNSTSTPKIQVGILLDVSGSMDGLIEQAKAQLWNMVSVMGKATCNNVMPQIEIALYEYGRTTNDPKKGFVKQIDGFTSDLDLLSKNLFSLKTDGGDEYCGQVIQTSLSELKWDTSSLNYKVIFIAGNEDFLQGNIIYTKACEEAKKKGVIVNTIYCGDRQQGIREHWNLAGECGNGSYTNINQNEKEEDIPTPYDSTLFVLNEQLNGTYVYYGAAGASKFADQESMDKSNYSLSTEVAAKRVAVKGKSNLYKNTTWDLVDAHLSDSLILDKVDMKTLPAEYQNKSRTALKSAVKEKSSKRIKLQNDISEVNSKREKYVAVERARSVKGTTATLETEVERIIKVQAKRYNMLIN
ncbi:MAG: vWA domain-containing protein [Ferruginibacter sp.]